MMPGPWNTRPALTAIAAGLICGVGVCGAALWALGALLRLGGVL